VIETAALHVILMGAQPYAMIKFTDDGEEINEPVIKLNLY
jgi:hypothetical protein